MKAVAAVAMALFVGVTTHAAESDETVTLMAGQSASYTTTTKAQQWTCKTSGDGSVVTAQATGGKFSLGSRVETLTITGTGAGSVKVDLYRGLTGGTLVKTIYVTVTKIQQTGAAQTLHVGETASPTCTAPYGSAWSASSSNPSVATVSVSGSGTSATPTITAVNEGSATVTIENGSAKWTFAVTVPARERRTAEVSVVAGSTATPTCTSSISGSWTGSSSDASVATVSVSGSGTSASPVITGVAAGSATVTVENAGAIWTISVTVTKTQRTGDAVTVPVGGTATPTCTSSASGSWTGSSSDASVAMVSVSGSGTSVSPVITGASVGSTTVTVENAGVVWTIPVTVTKAQKTASVEVVAGETKQLTFDLATSETLSVTGGDGAVATAGSATASAVSFTGVGAGSTTFSVGNAKAEWTVTVNVTKAQKTAAAVTVKKGEAAAVTCTSSSASGWTASSANPSVATVVVSGSGIEARAEIAGVAPGSTTVSVWNNGVVWSIPVTVSKIDHSGEPLTLSVASGDTAKLIVGPAARASVWEAISADTSIVKVTATGASATTFEPTFTGVGVGETTVSVESETDVWTVNVTVTPTSKETSVEVAVGARVSVNCTSAAAAAWSAESADATVAKAVTETGASSTAFAVPISGVSVGETTVTVRNRNVTWTIHVTVTKAAYTKSVTIAHIGDTASVSCTSAAASAWSVTSDDEGVATATVPEGERTSCTVSVKGIGLGATTVVAENDSAVWTIAVTVSAKAAVSASVTVAVGKAAKVDCAAMTASMWTVTSKSDTIATGSTPPADETIAFTVWITGHAIGTTKVIVESADTIYTIDVTVTEAPLEVQVGESRSFSVSNSKSVYWKNEVLPSGLVTVKTSGGSSTSQNSQYTVEVTGVSPGKVTVKVYTGTKKNSSISWSLYKTYEITVLNPLPPDSDLLTGGLRISEICPDDELKDPHGVNSGFIELKNCSDHAVNLKDWSLGRFNRGKEVKANKMMSLPNYSLAAGERFVVWANEGYIADEDGGIGDLAVKTPMMTAEEIKEIVIGGKSCYVMPLKISPKKYPLVVLGKTDAKKKNITFVADAVTVPVDTPSGWSVINLDPSNLDAGGATRRYITAKPTPGADNEYWESARVPPNVGPLYGVAPADDDDDVSDNDPVALAKPGEDYPVTLDVNPVYNGGAADAIVGVTLVYRAGLAGAEKRLEMTKGEYEYRHGQRWTATIPSADLPGRGQLLQWKALITDAAGNETKSPSFLNPDDGYEWYGTIVEPGIGATEGALSEKLPTFHIFAASGVADGGVNSSDSYTLDNKSLMNKDYDDISSTTPLGARCAIFDSSTSTYYDNVRIDLRGNSSAYYKKKSHGLRFAKAHPLAIPKAYRPTINGEKIKDVRKTSFLAEWCDPSYLRQLTSVWLLNDAGVMAPFEYPVRLNLNGRFYQLAFHSPRFTDDLIENIYALDNLAYSYKNVGSYHLKNDTSTSADAGTKKKTPDDGNEDDLKVLHGFFDEIAAAKNVQADQTGANVQGLDNAALTKKVVEKFDLPSWINYLAATRITCENDDMWGNMGGYYDHADLVDGETRGTDTWRPLAWDLNASWGQWYYAHDTAMGRTGLRADVDWHKSHPFYGGYRIPTWLTKKATDGTATCDYRSRYTSSFAEPNSAVESVYQCAKFRRLYVRRLRTLMDKYLRAPGVSEADTPAMKKMLDTLDLIRADAEKDRACWGFLGTKSSNEDCTWVNCWGAVGDGSVNNCQPNGAEAGVQDIWDNYIVPRRTHLYVTHSVTNAEKAIGYAALLNAGIPEEQSPFKDLAKKISLAYDADLNAVVIRNANAETVDLSGWTLRGPVALTFPGGTVIDWAVDDVPGELFVAVDRKALVAALDAKGILADQVIVGNGKFLGADAAFALTDADGNEFVKASITDEMAGEANLAEGRVSAYDVSVAYDGEEHTLDTKALKKVVIPGLDADNKEKVELSYSIDNETFTDDPPVFTDVGVHTLYYKIKAGYYKKYVHEVRVTISPSAIALVGDFDTLATYDAEGHTIGTNALVLAVADAVGDSFALSYALGEIGADNTPVLPAEPVWNDIAPAITNVGVAAVFFRVEAANHLDLVQPAWVTVTPREGVVVSVVGHAATNVYDSMEHSVEGYALTANDALYDLANVVFSGSAVARGTNAGAYPMGLAADAFANTNGNFEAVSFIVADGGLVIAKAAYDMSGVAWDYAQPFVFDGSAQSVYVTNLPAGITVDYAGNSAIDSGAYTATATFKYDAENYEPPKEIADLPWEIVRAKVAPDGGEPGGGIVPEGGLSAFDVTVGHDAKGHTINTDALVAAVGRTVLGEPVVVYALSADSEEWSPIAPAFTNVGEHVVWYGVIAANYEDFVHAAKVTILPPSEPLPEVKSDEEAVEVLKDSPDQALKDNVRTVADYTAFKAWVDGRVESGDIASEEAAKTSATAFLSFATDQRTLLSSEAVEAAVVRVAKTEVKSGAETGAGLSVVLTVSVDGLPVGDGARSKYLEKVFGVTGTDSLADGGDFRTDNVDYVEKAGDRMTADDHAVVYEVKPSPKFGTPGAFFFRATLAK